MALTETAFCEAVAYVLRCVGLTLKPQKEALIDGHDVFAWFPTGYGKSLCFQLLPFMFDFKLKRTSSSSERSVVLVLSPLVSLMIDQVSGLRKRGVSTAIIIIVWQQR